MESRVRRTMRLPCLVHLLALSLVLCSRNGHAVCPFSDVISNDERQHQRQLLQAAAGSQTAAGSSCTVPVNGKPQDYAVCQTLSSDSAQLQLSWNLTPDPSNGGTLMTAALQCAIPDGWCGWAIPAQPGRMVGASAVIVKACTNCSTGAMADKYLLAGKRPSAIVPGTGSLDIVGPIYAAKTGSGLIAVFTMRVTPDAAQPDAQTSYIAAHGNLDPSDTCQPHTDEMAVAGTLSLASGTGSSDSASNPTVDKATTAHGVLMTVAWAILLPISVAIALSMRKTWGPRTWFQIHRALGVIALLCILAGFGLGVYLWVTGGPDLPDILKAHLSIGVITTAFAILQAVAVLARPKPDAKYRGLWNHYHHSVGRIAVLLAFANALIGFYLGGLGWGWYLGLALIWSFIWFVAIAKAFYDRLREDRCTFIKKGGKQTNEATTKMSANPNNGAYSNMA